MLYYVRQNQTARPLLFLLTDSTDHVSAKTGATPTVTLSKNGSAFASPAGAISEVGSGWYQIAGNASDSNTLGPLLLHATASGADASDVFFEVVAFDPTSSWSTYAGGPVASVTGNVGGNVLGSVASVASDVGITQGAADKVWGSAARTLTGFGTLVADITAAVWGAATRTLSAIGFPVTAGTVLDKTGYSLASAPPSAQAIRDAVLDAAVSAHNTPGSVGSSLIAAGSAGDPWAALLPGNYISGQAGYTIGHNLDVPTGTRAPAGTLVTSIGPVLDGGTIQIVAGDTYQSERGTAIVRQYGGPVDLLTNPAPVITLEISAALIVLSVPVMASGTPGAIMLTAELSAAQSRLLRSKGSRFNYAYRAVWADADTDRVTVMTGVFNVSAER